MKLIVKRLNILDVSRGNAIKFSVQQVHTGQCRIVSTEKDSSRSDKVVYLITELNSHANTTVTG